MNPIGPSRDFVISGNTSHLDNVSFSNMSSEAARDVRFHILDIAAGLKPDQAEMKERAKYLVDKIESESGTIEGEFYKFVFGNRDELNYDFATDDSIDLRIRFAWNLYFRTNKNNIEIVKKAKPKRVFQFWDINPPEDVLELMDGWKTLAGAENYQLFSDEDARESIFGSLGAEGAKAYDSCWHPTLKSDFFRFVEMYERGGIYVDADEMIRDKNTDYFKSCTKDAHFFLYSNKFSSSIHSSILYGKPKMKVFQTCAEVSLQNIQRLNGKKANPMAVAGPGVLFDALIKTYGIKDEYNATSSGEFESNSQCATSYPAEYRKDNRSWQKAMGWQ